jgi:hypothetical protein
MRKVVAHHLELDETAFLTVRLVLDETALLHNKPRRTSFSACVDEHGICFTHSRLNAVSVASWSPVGGFGFGHQTHDGVRHCMHASPFFCGLNVCCNALMISKRRHSPVMTDKKDWLAWDYCLIPACRHRLALAHTHEKGDMGKEGIGSGCTCFGWGTSTSLRLMNAMRRVKSCMKHGEEEGA